MDTTLNSKFKKDDLVIYKAPHRQRGIVIGDMLAKFDRFRNDGSAVIWIKTGTQFNYRREVMPKYLRKVDE